MQEYVISYLVFINFVCSFYKITVYLYDDVLLDIEECSSCRSDGRVCNYGDTYDDDGVLSSWNFTCSRKGHNGLSKNAILGNDFQ